MTDQQKAKCLECGATSDQKVLLSCIKEGEETWVCVHCLPILIHGPHQTESPANANRTEKGKL